MPPSANAAYRNELCKKTIGLLGKKAVKGQGIFPDGKVRIDLDLIIKTMRPKSDVFM